MTSSFDFFPWFRNFTISPQTDWQRFINPQFNVTVNQGDAAIENHVLARVGSYGKQIGRMQEVLDLLIERLPEAELSPSRQRTIARYREMREGVEAAVVDAKRARGDADDGVDVGRWLDELGALRVDDPARFRRESDRLREFLERNPPDGPNDPAR